MGEWFQLPGISLSSKLLYLLTERSTVRDDSKWTPQHTKTLIDATQKETAIDQQQYSCETLICQRHQTILRLSSSVATASK